jgi:hypothetical protein
MVMHTLELKISVKGGISIDQLIELDRTLHVKVNEYLLSLPIKCEHKTKVIETINA